MSFTHPRRPTTRPCRTTGPHASNEDSDMADRAARHATYQDVLDAPANQIAELIDGVLRVSPRRAKPHALAASALGGELIPPFRRGRGGPGGWFLLDQPELHLEADLMAPDLAGLRRER